MIMLRYLRSEGSKLGYNRGVQNPCFRETGRSPFDGTVMFPNFFPFKRSFFYRKMPAWVWKVVFMVLTGKGGGVPLIFLFKNLLGTFSSKMDEEALVFCSSPPPPIRRWPINIYSQACEKASQSYRTCHKQ